MVAPVQSMPLREEFNHLHARGAINYWVVKDTLIKNRHPIKTI